VRDRFLEIVVFLISQLKDNQGYIDDIEEVSTYLKNQGFSDQEISSAYSWILDRLQTNTEFFHDSKGSGNATRVFSDAERQHFSPDAIGYVLQLSNLGLLREEQIESVLERGSLVWPAPVSLEQMKILIDSVMFSDSISGESSRDLQIYVADDNESVN
jgi:uncharacterized protein Smg (DUF494 family)